MHSATLNCFRSRSALSFSERSSRSEEHTSELQSQSNLVCRLLLEKKKTHPLHLRHAVPPGYDQAMMAADLPRYRLAGDVPHTHHLAAPSICQSSVPRVMRLRRALD